MSTEQEGRAKRVAAIKKLIIAFLVLGILIPIILCILLFVKVSHLQKQIDALSAEKERQKQVQMESAMAKPKEDEQKIVDMPEKMAGQLQIEIEKKEEEAKESERKVYLTFDDGPSANTDAILDILAKYDVKATFFVTGKTQEKYINVYRRIVEEGHTLGMHSYTHRYSEIYASKEGFVNDLEQLQDYLYEVTGVWSRFYRFPGGSSNQVSKVPMEELAKYLEGENIYYLDWNVSCKDATGERLHPQELADNVTDNVGKYKTSVVLLHDASDKTSTVEALPLIIEKLQEMEQTQIVPASDEMDMVQHLKQETNKKETEE